MEQKDDEAKCSADSLAETHHNFSVAKKLSKRSLLDSPPYPNYSTHFLKLEDCDSLCV